MSTVKRSARGSLVSSLGFVAQALQAVLLVPLLLSGWGAGAYALWLSCQACVQLLLTLDSGYQNYAGNEVAKRVHLDLGEARDTLGSALRFGLVLGCLELVFAALLAGFGQLERLLDDSSAGPATHESIGAIIVLSLIGWAVIGSSTGILARVYMAQGAFIRGSWWGLLQRLAIPSVAAAVALTHGGLVIAAIATSMVMLCLGFGFLHDSRRTLPTLVPFLARGDLRGGVHLFALSLPLAFGGFIGQLQVHGLTLGVASMLGAAAVAAFATIRTLANTLTQAAATLFSPAVPELVRYDVTGDTEKLRSGIFSLNVAANVPAAIACSGLVLVGQPLYEVWTRNQIPFDRPVLHAIAASVIWRVAGIPMLNHMIAMNASRWIIVSNVSQTGVLFGAGWLLAQSRGLYGISLAMLFGEVVGSVVLPTLWIALKHPHERRSFLVDQAFAFTSPVIATAVLFASSHVSGEVRWPLVVGGLFAQLVALTAQYRHLPTAVTVLVKQVLSRAVGR